MRVLKLSYSPAHAPHLAVTLCGMAKLHFMTDHGGSYPVHWQEPEPP